MGQGVSEGKKGPSASYDFLGLGSEGTKVLRLISYALTSEGSPKTQKGPIQSLESKTVHLQKTISDFLIPMILYFSQSKKQYYISI